MLTKGSVFQKGGGGTNFEQYVQSAFLTTLIVNGNIPCILNAELKEIAFQTTNLGYQTDDLLAIANSNLGEHRLLAQIKHNLIFSDTESNTTFKEVLAAFWKDFRNTDKFNKEKDRLVIIKSGLTRDERNHVRSILNWAKTHNTESDYFNEVNRIKAKKDYVILFKSVLEQANNNKTITKKDLWQFLKCLDILEYDFLNEGSVDENHFINLIKLSKSNKSNLSEKEIWDSIYVTTAKHNKDGGSITTNSIRKHSIYKNFDILKLTPYSKSIQKLKNDSQLILKPLRRTIGELNLERIDLLSHVSKSINDNKMTIVTGNPGVGKSAIVKDVLEKDFSQASVYIFRADQFNEPHLANMFSKQGIHESIQDIFSCVSLIPDKLIVIDSIEKLLEGDPENAFKQLLSLLEDYPDIKLVVISRKYALDLIIQKFGIENYTYNKIVVPEINEAELIKISSYYTQLKPVLNNKKLKTLLKSPKYLDFVLSSLNKDVEDLSSISITELKKKLWNNIIEDITTKKRGLARKRSKAFLNVAVKRAKQMKLFVEPDDNLEEGIEALEKDEIIFSEQNEYKFSPTHDILEDWALTKYVETNHQKSNDPKELFENLGNGPAIRRAFRLWIEDMLIDDSQKINNLIESTLRDNSIERYWADEVLIAIFKSEDCFSFFKAFENQLIENDGIFLNRCLHLIRTSCKESHTPSLLLPVGSGWKEILIFIKKYINQLEKYKLTIINFLFDWEYKLFFQSNIDEQELFAVKTIVLHYLNQVESGDKFWQQESVKNKSKDLFLLLLYLAHISKEEIIDIVERSFEKKEDHYNWRVNSFYKNVIDACISGIYTQELAKELPDLIINTAWKSWKLKRDPKNKNEGYIRSSFDMNKLSSDECWGIKDKGTFFPPGVFKTPIYNLLSYHTFTCIQFITEFINYSVDFYVSADCEYKHNIISIEIELDDGSRKTLWGAWELWAAYRGLSVTHYGLECILMSLEKFLLETASRRTKISKENTQFIFNYLIKNSNNVAIYGVLTSVAIAYPEEVGKEMLTLLPVKEFYQWDLNRCLQEHSAMAPMDMEISFAQEERHRLNQLEHRKKHYRGLRDFILDYQFNIRILNKEIHQIFDKLKQEIKKEDILWKKTLTEMDARNHEIGEYDKQLKGFPIKPKYDEEIEEFILSGKDEIDARNISMDYSGKIWKAYDKKVEIDFDFWNECFNHYLDDKNRNNLFDRPVSLAVLGLRDFNDKLSTNQLEWCIKTIIETNFIIISDTMNRNYNLNPSFNLMEKEISITAVHLVYRELDIEDKSIIIEMIIHLLSAPFEDHEVVKITKYIKNVFFRSFEQDAKRIWVGLIKYAHFKKSNPINYYSQSQAEFDKYNKKEQKFIKNLTSSKDLNVNIEDISFSSHECSILVTTLIITPYFINDGDYQSFVIKMIPLVLEDLKTEEDYSYRRKKDSRQIHYRSRHNIEQYLAELLITVNYSFAINVFDLLLTPIFQEEFNSYSRGRNELFEFVSNVPQKAIYELDSKIYSLSDEDQRVKLINNFWRLWEYFYELIASNKKNYFTPTLLLDLEWKTEASDWKALNNKQSFYKKIILELGENNSGSIINLFSSIGEKTFLPDCLSWLVILLQKNPHEKINLVSPSGERLIKRLFYNHIFKIKNDKQLLDNYIWILNEMIDNGSSQAYFFRENVITYKQNK